MAIGRNQIFSRHFSNGFSAYAAPSRGVAVQVELCVKTGSIHEEELLGCGISHYLEHMLFQGCRNYPARSVSDTVSSLGGNMNAYTTFDRTDYHIYLPAKHIEKAVDILVSMVRFPDFPQEVCRSEKEVIARECDLSLDKPGVVAIHNLISETYRVHPVRIPVIGIKDKILEVTREQLLSYHAKRYAPCRSFIVASGNVDPEKFFDSVEEKISDWKNVSISDPILPTEPEQQWKREREFMFNDNLARLIIGTRPNTPSKDIAAHNILWGALGMGSAGILPVKFTVNNPLALDLRIIDYNLPGGGLSAISAVARQNDIQKLRSGILKELENIAKNGVPSSAIAREKTQQYAEKLRRANDIEAVSAEIVDSVIVNGAPDIENSMFKKLNAVTVDEVRELAQKELAEEKLSIVIQNCKESAKKLFHIKQDLPQCRVSDTENSCQMLTLPDKSVPLTSVALIVPAGPVFDPQNQTGLSSMATRMLSTGTIRRSEEKLLAAMDKCGADFYAQCHANSAICQLTVPRKHFAKAFDIFLEQLFESSFNADIFERERQRIIDVLKHREITPSSAAAAKALDLLMLSHPSALGKDGSLDTVKTLDATAAKKQLQKMLFAGTMKIGFSGDISHLEAEKYTAKLLSFQDKNTTAVNLIAPPQFTKEELSAELPLAKEQSAAVMSIAGISAVTKKEQLAGAILRQLENGLSSRIFERVREDNSLAYSVGLAVKSGLQRGAIIFHATTAKGKTQTVFSLFREELARLQKREITVAEFDKAKEQAAFSACGNLNNPTYLLPEMLLDLYYGNPVLTDPLDIEKEYLNFTLDDFYQVFDTPFNDAVPVSVAAGNI